MSDTLLDKLTGNQIVVWGRNPTVGTAPEDLTAFAQPTDWWAILGAGAKLDVTSSNAADASSGTAARTIRIVGLGTDGRVATEIVTLNGQTIVTTATSWTDVFGADVISHGGTTSGNVGDLYLVKTGTGGSYTGGVPGTITSAVCKVLATWNTEMLGHYTVPLGGPNYRLRRLNASAYTQSATVFVAVRGSDGVDKSLHLNEVFGIGSAGNMSIDFDGIGLVVTPGQSIIIRAQGASASAVVQATMYLDRV